MEDGSNDPCNHSGRDRYISGVFTHVELWKAVEELGYRVVQVHEVWDFKKWSKGLFSGYIDKYFTIKEEVNSILVDIYPYPPGILYIYILYTYNFYSLGERLAGAVSNGR
jgi:hypothetical protein